MYTVASTAKSLCESCGNVYARRNPPMVRCAHMENGTNGPEKPPELNERERELLKTLVSSYSFLKVEEDWVDAVYLDADKEPHERVYDHEELTREVLQEHVRDLEAKEEETKQLVDTIRRESGEQSLAYKIATAARTLYLEASMLEENTTLSENEEALRAKELLERYGLFDERLIINQEETQDEDDGER